MAREISESIRLYWHIDVKYDHVMLTHSIHLMSIIDNIFILVVFFCRYISNFFCRIFLMIVYSRYNLTFTFEFIWCRGISHLFWYMNTYMYMCTIEIDVAMHNANAAAWLFVLFWGFFFRQAWWCIQEFEDNQKLWLYIDNKHTCYAGVLVSAWWKRLMELPILIHVWLLI